MAKADHKIALKSTAKTAEGEPTGTRYYTTKNKKNVTEKLSLRKYDRRVRKVVEFKEEKIKK